MVPSGQRAPEIEPIYGIRTPLASWNPIWANLHIFVGMARDAWRTQVWQDKFRRALVADRLAAQTMLPAQYPQPKSDLAQFEKYNPSLSSRVHGAIIAQYAVLSIIHLWSAGQAAQLPLLTAVDDTVVAQAYISGGCRRDT